MIDKLVRENIRRMEAYSSARNEYSGNGTIFLDANESPYNSPLNRYPDPGQLQLKQKIGALKNVPAQNIFLGNGSDEAIDLLFRVFCRPGIDNVISISPTYGMYEVCANVNEVELQKISLTEKFHLNTTAMLQAANPNSKLMFLCSPNNPTGNLLNKKDILHLVKNFSGIVVLDEAYIDFSANASMLQYIKEFDNLVVLQTLSKAYGNAAIRLGMAFANAQIINYLSKIKYPYNINLLSQETAMQTLNAHHVYKQQVNELNVNKDRFINQLKQLSIVEKIHPSDANFVLVRFKNATRVYKKLMENGIIVRDRSKIQGLENCLRISIGSKEQMEIVIEKINNLV